MTRGRGRPPKVKVNPVTGLDRSMTMGELNDIKQQKLEAEGILKHVSEHQVSGAGEAIDKNRLKAQIDRYDAILHEGAPQKVRGLNKDRLAREAQDLREKMQRNMPTMDEMMHPSRNPGAVQKHMKWEARNLENIKRYKEVMRTIEPDDPTNTSIDRLRREK